MSNCYKILCLTVAVLTFCSLTSHNLVAYGFGIGISRRNNYNLKASFLQCSAWHESENVDDENENKEEVNDIDPKDVDEWWEPDEAQKKKTADKMIATQLAASKKVRLDLEEKYGSNPELLRKDLDAHLDHQSEAFDSMADFFNSEEANKTPDGEDVRPLLRQITRRALRTCIESRAEGRRSRGESDAPTVEEEFSAQDIKEQIMYIGGTDLKIVDVGCGSGALFEYYLEAAEAFGVCLDLTAFDLSANMAQNAKVHAAGLLAENGKFGGNGHRIHIVNGDFISAVLNRGEDGQQSKYFGSYDAVIINACFGNFFSTGELSLY